MNIKNGDIALLNNLIRYNFTHSNPDYSYNYIHLSCNEMYILGFVFVYYY